MHSCPNCSCPDWKKITTTSESSYSECKNCKYSLYGKLPKPETGADFEQWCSDIMDGADRALEAHSDALQVVYNSKKASIVETANVNRAKRELDKYSSLVTVVEGLRKVVKSTEQGSVTVLLPQFGIIKQFSWGDCDILAAVLK